MNQELSAAIAIANKHAERLQYAITQLSHKFPLSAVKIDHLTNEDIAVLELFTSRFAKLQDFMGTKLYPLFLKIVEQEDIDSTTFIDKLNKLEKLRIIDSAHKWKEMRNTRNHISHEYPNDPGLAATHLNAAYNMAPELLKYLATVILACKKIN